MDEQAQAQAQAQAQIFLNINRELTSVSQALTAQGISSTVLKFDGNPKNFREWVKSIEKYATLVNIPDDRKKAYSLSVINRCCKWIYPQVYAG